MSDDFTVPEMAEALEKIMTDGDRELSTRPDGSVDVSPTWQARAEAAEAKLGAMCAYPLCECGPGKECMVIDGPVPDVCARADLKEAAADMRERAAKLFDERAERLRGGVVDFAEEATAIRALPLEDKP